ncbi:MAG: tRNA pseudouridine(55) synthase TruB [Candidatus Nanopelagicaceae bacterium]|nr:tRNA pseudouridine(55) synthase TruB [Candidatus Nanopelagicaceae bacterium]
MITDGFLVVDKSPGMTSHDVVAIARRALGTKKVGHAGTLDPMATGILVLGFGNGTRLLQYITDGEKEYVATIVLGSSTVTDDSEGVLLFEAPAEKITAVSNEQINNELEKMIGHIRQRPSSVSAVKVAGERAHARVRAGESFELPAREVHISSLVVKEIRRLGHSIEVDIEVTCGAGTFIRAIARDCGQNLEVGGHLNALRRTRVATFGLERAISVESLKSGDFVPLHIGEVAAKTFPIRELSQDETRELSFGRVISSNATDRITAAMEQDQLIALLSNEEDHARPIAVFAPKS